MILPCYIRYMSVFQGTKYIFYHTFSRRKKNIQIKAKCSQKWCKRLIDIPLETLMIKCN